MIQVQQMKSQRSKKSLRPHKIENGIVNEVISQQNS
jgi:hypothetical protein